ncbi:unnamed protein product [Larinioides sclopetarius]|uniref:Major facilitator superfamily associated domain-containing protein n=1 Tax=Larinioides sclopetarius TaxID=280406 RepID=A0AAV2BTS9_9ARAC
MEAEENKKAVDVYVIPCESSEKLKKIALGSIDKEILRYKLIFFLHNGGLAAAFFYIALIAKERVGLSSLSLGAMLTVQMFLFTFTKPLIGYISDYFNSLKITICVLTLLNITCFFSIFAIPKIDREEITNVPIIFKEMAYNTTKLCDKCADFLQFSQNDSNPEVDTACCESIEKSKVDFGKLRLWGNVGWGLMSPIGGLLNDYTGGFLASTVVMAVLLLSFLYNITQLDLTKSRYSNTICRDIGSIFRSKEFFFFELINLINGLEIGIIWYYLAWFITTLGGSQLLCGLSVAVQSFGGVIPFMFFSGWIIRKFGHYEIVSFALMVNGLRFLFYSQLYQPWWILLIEISHGITYGLYYTALATYGKLTAKPGTEATVQSILFTTHEGLGQQENWKSPSLQREPNGAGIGCGFAGIGFDYFGSHQTFFYLSAFFGCNFLLSLLFYFFFVRKRRRLISINSVP